MRILILLSGILLPVLLSAQPPEVVRGGWYADIDGVRHIYLLVQRDSHISGVYCTDCSDPASVAFIDDGRLEGRTAEFTVFGEEDSYRVEAELEGETLLLTRHSSEGSAQAGREIFSRFPFEYVRPSPPGGFVVPPPYEFPAAPVAVVPEAFLGLWVAGTGPGKQYFIFKRFRDGIRGLACGSCDDTRNMAVIDDLRMEGDRLYFNIIHEDSGPGYADYGPHWNRTEASIARNEMHLWVVPSFEQDPDWAPVEMTLHGPIRYQP